MLLKNTLNSKLIFPHSSIEYDFLKLKKIHFNNIIVSLFLACQMVLVDLLVSLMSSQTCSEELTLLLRIFLEKTPCTVCVDWHIAKVRGLMKKIRQKRIFLCLRILGNKKMHSNVWTDQSKYNLVVEIVPSQDWKRKEEMRGVLKDVLVLGTLFSTRNQESSQGDWHCAYGWQNNNTVEFKAILLKLWGISLFWECFSSRNCFQKCPRLVGMMLESTPCVGYTAEITVGFCESVEKYKWKKKKLLRSVK